MAKRKLITTSNHTPFWVDSYKYIDVIETEDYYQLSPIFYYTYHILAMIANLKDEGEWLEEVTFPKQIRVIKSNAIYDVPSLESGLHKSEWLDKLYQAQPAIQHKEIKATKLLSYLMKHFSTAELKASYFYVRDNMYFTLPNHISSLLKEMNFENLKKNIKRTYLKSEKNFKNIDRRYDSSALETCLSKSINFTWNNLQSYLYTPRLQGIASNYTQLNAFYNIDDDHTIGNGEESYVYSRKMAIEISKLKPSSMGCLLDELVQIKKEIENNPSMALNQDYMTIYNKRLTQDLKYDLDLHTKQEKIVAPISYLGWIPHYNFLGVSTHYTSETRAISQMAADHVCALYEAGIIKGNTRLRDNLLYFNETEMKHSSDSISEKNLVGIY